MLMLRDRWKKPDENRENQDPYRNMNFIDFQPPILPLLN